MYIVTSKPKRISVNSGFFHMILNSVTSGLKTGRGQKGPLG